MLDSIKDYKYHVLLFLFMLALSGKLLFDWPSFSTPNTQLKFPLTYAWEDYDRVPRIDIISDTDLSLNSRNNRLREWLSEVTRKGYESKYLCSRRITKPKPVGVGHTQVIPIYCICA